MRAVVVVPSYDCADVIGRCLDSIAEQDYPEVTVCVIDDASPNPEHWQAITAHQAPNVGREGWVWRTTLYFENRGALRNIYEAVQKAEDEDVVILVDGDDYLPHPGCVSRIMALYDDPDCWMAWGSYVSEPHDPECPESGPFPPEVVEARSFRQAQTLVNHPISFRAWLFRLLTTEDLTYPDGTWIRHLYDEAIAYPLLEMAVDRWRFCDEVLYVYNTANPLSVNKARLDEAMREGAELRSRPPKDALPRS